MQPPLARELRVEGDHEHVVLAGGDGMAVDGGEDLDPLPRVGDPRRADEDRAHGRPVDARDPQVGLERADLAAERVAAAGVVGQAEVLAVEHDHPGAGAEHRRAAAHELAQRVAEALAGDAERHRRRLARRASRARRARRGRAARGPRAPRRRARAAAARAPRSPPAARARRPAAPWTTSPGWRGAAAPRACASPARPSRSRGPRTRRRRGRDPGSGWSPRRSRRRAAPGRRT